MRDESTKPWERQPNEPSFWYGRFLVYLQLGPERSLLGSYNEWRVQKYEQDIEKYNAKREDSKNPSKKPQYPRKLTGAPISWRNARDEWNWENRAEAHDIWLQEEATRKYEKRRQEVISQGYAVQHERIAQLDAIAERLLEDLQDPDKLWLKDAKGIGSDGNYEKINLVRFNGSLLSEIRNTFSDIAAELGQRVKVTEVSGPGGSPISMQTGPDLENMNDDQKRTAIGRLADVLNKIAQDGSGLPGSDDDVEEIDSGCEGEE